MLEIPTNVSSLFMPAVAVGVIATIVMDIWALFLTYMFKVPSLNYGFVGRWSGHMVLGKWSHSTIAHSPAIPAETFIGWTVHYVTGILFALVLLICVGLEWLQDPNITPALLTGAITLIFPFFIMQPCFGLGIAAAKTPEPQKARFRSFMAHMSFGVGLYIAALLLPS